MKGKKKKKEDDGAFTRTTKLDKESEKLLKPFFNSKSSLEKRWKSFLSWLEFKRTEPDELQKFFTDQFYAVFSLLKDAVDEYETNAKRGKRDHKFMDQILIVLDDSVRLFADLIKQKWQNRAFYKLLCSLLYKENKYELRLHGLELLLRFLDNFRPPLEEFEQHREVLGLLGQCLVFEPFCPPGVTPTFAVTPLEAPSDAAVWQPGNDELTFSEAEEVMLRVFRCVNSTRAFEFWLEVIKVNVFTVLYPQVSRQIKLLPEGQNTGFEQCPPYLQNMVISNFTLWMGSPEKAKVVWGSSLNTALALEIYTQAVSLPTRESAITEKAVLLFNSLFMAEQVPEEMKPRISQYRRYFLKKLPLVFTMPLDPETLPLRAKTCNLTLKLLREDTARFPTLDKKVQDMLLGIPLNAAKAFFAEGVNPELAGHLAYNLTSTSVWMWIRTRPASWKAVQNVVAFSFNVSSDAITAARDHLLQMALVVQRFHYPQYEAKVSKRKLGAGGEKTKDHVSVVPDALPKLEVEEDERIASLDWDAESSLLVFREVLGLFSSVNTIKDPAKYAVALDALVEVQFFMMQLEAGVPFKDGVATPPLIDLFGPIYLGALTLPDSHAQGKCRAVKGLSRLLRSTKLPSCVYQAVFGFFASQLEEHPGRPVTNAILLYNTHLYSRQLPGSVVLIPHVFAAITDVCNQDEPVPRVVSACATLVSSLICYPQHYGARTALPCLLKGANARLPFPLAEPKKLTMGEFDAFIVELLRLLLTKCPADQPELFGMCFSGLTVFVLNGIHTRGDSRLVTGALNELLRFCSHEETPVARHALECVASLSESYAALVAYDAKLALSVVEVLANDVVSHLEDRAVLKKKFQLREDLVVSHFECLSEWLLAVPSSVLEHPVIHEKVFAAIELGLLGETTRSTIQKRTRKQKRPKLHVELFEEHIAEPGHNSKAVQAGAQVLLMSILNRHNNWPGPGGASLDGTRVTETSDTGVEDNNTVFFYANGSVLSLTPLGSVVRVIVRDVTGRYAWDARTRSDDGLGDKAPPLTQFSASEMSAEARGLTVNLTTYTREKGQPPTFKRNENAVGVDKVAELLAYMEEIHAEANEVGSADTGIAISESLKPFVDSATSQLTAQVAALRQVTANSRAEPARPPEPQAPEHPFHRCRQYLSHFNLIDYDQRKLFSMLQSGAPLQRSVNTLDAKRSREVFKIGLLYVRHGQDHQTQIMLNETRSPGYDQFVRGLGWEVDMAHHKGYVGGLDTTKFLTGKTAPYYASPNLELMLHDITCMPTDHKDPQQIHKKRHVGNDVVNIVWSEHERDYNPQTISTQFNCAHIIVYPLPSGLFRIEVARKVEQVYPLFGPLINGMCVSATILAQLARRTALNANKNFLSHKSGYLKPVAARIGDVDTILERYTDTEHTDYTSTIVAAYSGEPVAVSKKPKRSDSASGAAIFKSKKDKKQLFASKSRDHD